MNKQLDMLIEVFLNIKSKNEMSDFLQGILTPQELDELPRRLEIVKMLKKGIPQHEVSKKLGVGIATVTRGSKELQKGRFSKI
jgi:TrpR family trp operon transcriptional repressor